MKKVQDIMSRNVACCSPDTQIRQVARMMIEHDCGEIPVVDSAKRPVGVVTDRDICCRAVAEGMDCADTAVSQVMTSNVICCKPESTVEECCQTMEKHLIRRMPIVDENGAICGIVSQADLASKTNGELVDDLLKEVSRPTESAARV